MDTENIFFTACGAAVLIMLIYYRRRKRRPGSALFGALTGLASLMLVNCFGSCINADVPLNLFNICGSTVLGAPFVVCITVLRMLPSV